MRIRSTKPKFWESKTISQLDWATRLVLKGLESYVDDNGVGKDDLELIATNVFPRDTFRNPPETFARLSEAISVLAAAGLIVRYSRGGERLLYVDDWKGLQRIDKPAKGRFPRPDGTMEYSEEVNRDSYGSPPEHSAPGVGEQGNRGTGEKEPPNPPSDESPAVTPLPTRTKNGAEVARQQFSSIPVQASPKAQRIAQLYSESLSAPLEARVQAKVANEIDACLRSEIPPDAIAAGIKAWAASDSWSPTQIPQFVHKAAAKTRAAGVGKPTEKALGYEASAERVIAAMEANR